MPKHCIYNVFCAFFLVSLQITLRDIQDFCDRFYLLNARFAFSIFIAANGCFSYTDGICKIFLAQTAFNTCGFDAVSQNAHIPHLLTTIPKSYRFVNFYLDRRYRYGYNIVTKKVTA